MRLQQTTNTALRHRQRGQATIYGLFVLIASLAALFYLFNVGQLSHEKTRLINTADAVAYSGGLIEARSMNFAAYTNRALVANEVAIAQAVTMASWLKYMETHGETAITWGCYPYPYMYTYPVWKGFIKYLVPCTSLSWAETTGATPAASNMLQASMPALMTATEAIKKVLQLAATALPTLSLVARKQTMDQVALANYHNLGQIEVDHLSNTALKDDFALYGSGDKKQHVIESYTRDDTDKGDRRQRMADMAVRSVRMDGFTPERSWSDRGAYPGCFWDWNSRPRIDRSGSTQLVNYDEWRATDMAAYTEYYVRWRWSGISCRSWNSRLGYGSQSASSASASTSDWTYSGIPNYLDLTNEALNKDDPRLLYAVQLRRPLAQTSTSEGRSGIENTTRINPYRANAAADNALFGLAGVEVFFQRPDNRSDGKTELPSLFNPYWQAHLVELPDDVKRKALALLAITSTGH